MSGATALSLQGHTTPPLKVWDTQKFFFFGLAVKKFVLLSIHAKMPSSYITVAYIFKAAKFFILSNYKRSSLEKPYMHPKIFF